MDRPQDIAYRADQGPASIMAKVVAVFAIVGLGLGGGTLLFLWSTGFFDAAPAEGLDALGRAFLGGVAISVVLVFALLIGVVLAALGGMYAASTATSRESAAGSALAAGVVGHVVLVGILGAMLVYGIEALGGWGAGPESFEVMPDTRTEQELAECRALFGEDSPLCVDEPFAPDAEEEVDEGAVTVEDVSRLALGLVPAGIVGALTATVLYRRRVDLGARA